MGAHHRAIDHDPFKISVGGKMVEQGFPDALLLPACEPLVDAVPIPDLVG